MIVVWCVHAQSRTPSYLSSLVSSTFVNETMCSGHCKVTREMSCDSFGMPHHRSYVLMVNEKKSFRNEEIGRRYSLDPVDGGSRRRDLHWCR